MFAFGGKDIPKIRFKEPPWWKDRDAGLRPKLGRGGWTKPEKLKFQARLLKRDYIETPKWSEIHFSSKDSTFKRLIAEVKKDNPDKSLVDKYVLDLEYLRWMIDAIQNASSDLAKLPRE